MWLGSQLEGPRGLHGDDGDTVAAWIGDRAPPRLESYALPPPGIPSPQPGFDPLRRLESPPRTSAASAKVSSNLLDRHTVCMIMTKGHNHISKYLKMTKLYSKSYIDGRK